MGTKQLAAAPKAWFPFPPLRSPWEGSSIAVLSDLRHKEPEGKVGRAQGSVQSQGGREDGGAQTGPPARFKGTITREVKEGFSTFQVTPGGATIYSP